MDIWCFADIKYKPQPRMYYVLDQDTIEREIVPHLPRGKRGPKPRPPLCEIVNCVLYKLKTGVQWHLVPVASLFSGPKLHYKTVFGHFRNWCRNGIWKMCWIHLLDAHRSEFDLSSVDLDGSHTTAVKGGEAVAYQGRKKRKTTNALYLTDRQGLPLAMSEPVAGNHNDVFEIHIQFEHMIETLKQARIDVEGLFLNADAGFDAQTFRQQCQRHGIIGNIALNKRNGADREVPMLDTELYRERYAIERTNAWMDSFRSILTRFDTTVSSWRGFNYLTFIVLALRKFNNNKNSR